MNAVIPFAFEDNLVRALWRKGDPWFVAKDVCGALELRDVSDAAEKLDDDEKGRASIPTLGGPQDLLIVSEGGLYSIVLRCRDAMKPGTVPHRFRRWVTGEVLPSLRKTGQYTAPTAPAPEAIEERNLRAEEHKLALVARMQAMKGPAYAFALYEKLGLPVAAPQLPATGDWPDANLSPAMSVLVEFAAEAGTWTGTSGELLTILNDRAYRGARQGEDWPITPRALTVAIDESARALAKRGVEVDRWRTKNARLIKVSYLSAAP